MPHESSFRFRGAEIIVLGIVLVLFAALLMPAIFAAREAGRRIECEHHLKSLSLGVLAYTDTFRHFPSGTVGSRELSPAQRFSWYLPLWVFIEGKPPKLLVDTNQAWDAEVNRSPKLRHVVDWDQPTEHTVDHPLPYLPWFSCPSASLNLRVQGIQVTQYVGMAGLGINAPELAIGDAGVGIWGYDRHIAMSAITDGTANTMLFVETGHDLGAWLAGGRPTVRGLNVADTQFFSDDGQFGGLHSTIPATMADASVRQIDPRIDTSIFKALTTIAGGDPQER